MYGMIHKAVEAMTCEVAGEDVWNSIREQSGLDDAHFISGQSYSDDLTMALIGAAQAELDIPLEDLLERFGRYWIEFAGKTRYSNFMDMAGDDVETFMDSLDNMHASIRASMPGADMPSFEAQTLADGRLEVIYRSSREGLEPFVVGLLHGVLERFDQKGSVTFEVKEGQSNFYITLDTQP